LVQLLTWATIALAGVLVTLLAMIVGRRMLADRRRKREELVRPEIERTMAVFLAGDDPEPPPLPASRVAHEVALASGLLASTELRGAERQRLVMFLEGAGIVGETAASLYSRRRRIRRRAAESLGQIASPQSAGDMLGGLRDPDLDVRLSCASGLAEVGDPDFVPPVLATADRAARDRPGAAAAILVTLGRRTPLALGEGLASQDGSPEMRRLCAAVIGELRLAEHAPLLRAALQSDDHELVARAARGLGMIGDMDATHELLGLMEERERPWYVRLSAAEALGELGDPLAVGPLELELLSSEGWSEQSTAASALRQLGGAGEEALRRALASPVAAVRAHAQVALEQ
jgi:HEAT repeat protein